MMPDMASTLFGLTTPIQFAVVSKTMVDYEVSESKAAVRWMDGQCQPLPPQQLKVKPEGQRTWKWWLMYTTEDLKLDDILQDDCKRQYRVMEKTDWSQAGYYAYELTEKAVA